MTNDSAEILFQSFRQEGSDHAHAYQTLFPALFDFRLEIDGTRDALRRNAGQCVWGVAKRSRFVTGSDTMLPASVCSVRLLRSGSELQSPPAFRVPLRTKWRRACGGLD